MAQTNVQAFSGDVAISSNLAVDTNTLFVDSVGNKVGIGTTNPVGVNGGQCLEGSSSTGFEYIATRDDTTGNSGDFVGAYLFKNADTDGTEPHYAGMSSKLTGGNGPMDLRFHTNRDNYEADIPQMIISGAGNVGIGKADPGSALDVVGDVAISSNLAVDTNTLFVDSVGNKVGIGVTGPTTKFTLYGDDTEDEGGLLMKVVNRVALNNGFTGIGLGGYGTTTLQVAKSAIIHERTGLYGTGNLMFCNDGTTDDNDVSNTHARMTITSSGNVGIGKTNPGSALDVVGDVAISSNLAVDTNTLFVDSVGNKVGIGTASPSSVFTSYGGGLWDGSDHISKVCATLQVARGGGVGASSLDSGTGVILELRHSDDYRHITIESVSEASYSGKIGLRFKTTEDGTGPQERMRIDASGNVGIGTDNPYSYQLVAPGRVCLGQLGLAHREGSSTSLKQVSHSNGSDRIFQFKLNSTSSWVPGFFKIKAAVVNHNGGSGFAWGWEAGFKVVDNNNDLDQMTTISGSDPGSSWFSMTWDGTNRILTLTVKDNARQRIVAECEVVFNGGIQDA